LLTYKQYSAFEDFYITMTRSFYLAESAEQAEALKNNPKEFFRRGKERIGEEIKRSKAILPVTAWSLVREITEKAFWGGRMEWLSEKSKSLSLSYQR
jgi:cullin 4